MPTKAERDRLLAVPALTIPQVIALLGCGRDKAEAMIASGAWLTVRWGTRVKVKTSSIVAQVDKETRALRDRVGLPTPRPGRN